MAELFRPRHISDVIGQDTVKNIIRRSLRNNSFPKFTLMYGQSGTGKSTMAEICGLSLTCENPDGGEPCCKCKSCVDNLNQLNAGHNSMNLVKVNMGSIERSDFKKTVHEIFTLKPMSDSNAVYIFEEIQALTRDDQNILLEYISNIQENVYVISCTTEFGKLRQELRNRAIKFRFKNISTDQAITLLNKVCSAKGVTSPKPEIARFLIRSVSNCPREIVNLVNFLSDAESLTSDSLTEFLGYVSNDIYIEFLRQCNKSTFEFVEWLEGIGDTGYQNVVIGLRNFLIDCYQYIYGGNTQFFNTQEKHNLKEVFNNVSEEKMHSMMKYFSECSNEDDYAAKYALIHGRMIFRNESQKSIISNSRRNASESVIKSEKATRTQIKVAGVFSSENKVVSDRTLDDLLGGFKKIKSANGTQISGVSSIAENTSDDDDEFDLNMDDLIEPIDDMQVDDNTKDFESRLDNSEISELSSLSSE